LLGAAGIAAPARALAPEDEELEPIDSVEPADPHMRTRVADTHDPTALPIRCASPPRTASRRRHARLGDRPPCGVGREAGALRTIFGYED
jgi:hypothetical protein